MNTRAVLLVFEFLLDWLRLTDIKDDDDHVGLGWVGERQGSSEATWDGAEKQVVADDGDDLLSQGDEGNIDEA
ncbi:hypothetical protein QVD17_30968 [Tagetes erecta]|uniref:Uncharacterized protein n=1 Tax=Tagetes erecta TaxID=13708 RepID=A0AAD8K8W0_TARER|nr:hypothetical protein QVD17_30968 [Tagetes erecta]